jgi:hypothetical protein
VGLSSDPHINDMRTDFALFRERLAKACSARDTTETKVCSQIGIGSKRAIHLALAGAQAIDVWRLCQIADQLDVSLDWLTGRSNVMSVMEMPEEFEPEPPRRKLATL